MLNTIPPEGPDLQYRISSWALDPVAGAWSLIEEEKPPVHLREKRLILEAIRCLWAMGEIEGQDTMRILLEPGAWAHREFMPDGKHDREIVINFR